MFCQDHNHVARLLLGTCRNDGGHYQYMSLALIIAIISDKNRLARQ